jgi:hypothetical protein
VEKEPAEQNASRDRANRTEQKWRKSQQNRTKVEKELAEQNIGRGRASRTA